MDPQYSTQPQRKVFLFFLSLFSLYSFILCPFLFHFNFVFILILCIFIFGLICFGRWSLKVLFFQNWRTIQLVVLQISFYFLFFFFFFSSLTSSPLFSFSFSFLSLPFSLSFLSLRCDFNLSEKTAVVIEQTEACEITKQVLSLSSLPFFKYPFLIFFPFPLFFFFPFLLSLSFSLSFSLFSLTLLLFSPLADQHNNRFIWKQNSNDYLLKS